MKLVLLIYLIGCFLQFFSAQGFQAKRFEQKGTSNICTESNKKTCKDCISLPGCAWCSDPLPRSIECAPEKWDYVDNPNLLISRCDTPENLMSNEVCSKTYISNPRSKSKFVNDTDLSNVGETAIGTATQMKPQVIDVKLRPGDPVDIRFSFKQAEDYPVDLYYLLDLSQSMENDLESLRALGQQLGESMQNITRDFRLGFGSFVDKTVMPFISTIPSKLRNPCSEQNPCDPTYSFSNTLPLTPNITSFVDSVNGVTHSSNLDNPEGGLDAMMQAVVCQEEINWRERATHLLVYSTDATFHYAGDGKLGGIVFPNDGRCYLDNDGKYTMANEMDYPSIGHLVRKITEHKIQPIFAVTKEVFSTYENLKKMIPKSVVGKLTSDSSNIIGLIQKAYNDLKGQILIEIKKLPSDVNITNKMSFCKNTTREGVFECDGVKLGDVVNFTFSLSTSKCLKEPMLMQLEAYGYDEKINITIDSLCECDCPITEAKPNCSDRGDYKCGVCVCEPGYTGLDCSCDTQGQDSYLINCTDSNGVVCNDRGTCQCGTCICNPEPDRLIDGKFCECDNTTCDHVKGKICNEKGKCKCGICQCDKGWTGRACDCSSNTETCFENPANASNPNSKPCSGNGKCKCGACVCNTIKDKRKYRGQYCQTQVIDCESHRNCVLCLAFGIGAYNESECSQECSNYNVSKLSKEEGSGNERPCRYTDSSDGCSYETFIEELDNDEVLVDVSPEKFCVGYANPLHIILGIIAAIVGIGLALLLIWKLLTSIKDAREFKNFQKESQNPKWQGGENPIFKKATSTFRNPMYTGGKPANK